MADKPTSADLIAWLRPQTTVSESAQALYEEVVEVATVDIESRINLPVGTTDETYPDQVRMAIILQASRLAKRSSSPEGVAGMSDLGAVVRILGSDPDIERLLARFLKWDGFA